jgi:uncharacterized protein
MKRTEKPYISPYLGGALLGVVLFSAYALTGSGLGASGAILRVQTAALKCVASRHVDHTGYFAQYGGGAANPLDDGSVWMLLGTLLGGMVSGIFFGRFKLETRGGVGVKRNKRWLLAFAGGMLMGWGARLARGCTSGQALSGGAVLAVGSWAFMLAVFAGGYALAWFVRHLWRE